MQMRIAGITHESVTDGPGMRSVIFFQGCPHACLGCHNPHTWSALGGYEIDANTLMVELKLTPLITGVTFSGGDPFAQAAAAAEVAGMVKSQRKNLWVYTGYTWENLMERYEQPGFASLIEYADVIVDGPYMQNQRNLDLPYRGSRNQRLILVKESLENNTVIEWHSASYAARKE